VPVAAVLALAGLFQPAAHASRVPAPGQDSKPVDLVIALDVSGSMSGLIQSAKQRLWDVVNELNRAQPQPDLRVAVLSYGNPRYGKQTGYVHVDVPFTRDLDAVNEALFGLSTNGGSEYVARVIATAGDRLEWSADQAALRIMFVAGNEAATQDPVLPVMQVAQAAKAKGIVVNTLYCGNDDGNGVASGWRQVAAQADGFYASIDQHVAAAANVATPYDSRLRELNVELNKTYVPYGEHGSKRRDNQIRQDMNAEAMSAPAAASRAVTKAGSAYRGAGWDLVDALEAGTALDDIAPEALPPEMREMDAAERERYVATQSERRAAIRGEIQTLDEDRRAFIQRERAAEQAAGEAGLDSALRSGLLEAAKKKGFRFD
jgi:hypothetical protein